MIICADDYGMRAEIDRAILELSEAGKLSAVSCMVLFQRCDRGLMEQIRRHEQRVDIGLHVCLTREDQPLSLRPENRRLPTFGNLLCPALFRQLDRDQIFSLLAAQYELFVQKSGRAPDFIDGHLHAHQLPVVAETLIDFVRQLPANQRPYVRNTRATTKELRRQGLPWLKASIIGVFGARLEWKLRHAGISTNAGFAGIYDFGDWQRYRDFFPRFVDCLPEENGILVTHPGYDEPWRRMEFDTLAKHSAVCNRFKAQSEAATSAIPLA